MLIDSNVSKRPPLIVEVVGPAGAGKTTILSALNRHRQSIRPIYGFRRKRYIPFYAGHALLLLPFLMRRGLAGKWPAWQEINRMIRLKAMHPIVKRLLAEDGTVTVLDQGPVYTLSVLAGFGSESTRDPAFIKWWEQALRAWADTLDLIVWLDAPDSVLLERIHTRDKQHCVKDKSDREAMDFLMRFRTVYKQVMDKLAAEHQGPALLCYDTSQQSLAYIVGDTLAALDMNTENGGGS